MEFQSHSCPFIIFTPQLMIASAKLLLISCYLYNIGAKSRGLKKIVFLFFLLKQNDYLFREMERAASFKLDMGHRLLTNHPTGWWYKAYETCSIQTLFCATCFRLGKSYDGTIYDILILTTDISPKVLQKPSTKILEGVSRVSLPRHTYHTRSQSSFLRL